ncbi:MAG: 4Fe-4S binding protein [Methanobrevibacter sp.]|jgi:energy-converting hydrogenase B subunit K|nr:4Fe-4S binding protein [Candidatus Methanovirga basalitermitum]
MYLSTNKCEGIGECIKRCPTGSIRMINGKAFSCISCGICFDTCPNHAISKNRLNGYIVDKERCNGCGICKFVCPVSCIHIKNGKARGICSRCSICNKICPKRARLDGFKLVKEKQEKYLKSLDSIQKMLNTDWSV